MKQIVCDRCGEVIKYSQSKPAFAITNVNTGVIMDMCKECREDLINFILGGRVVNADFIEKAESENVGDTNCIDEDAKQASIPYTYNAPQHDWKCGYPDTTIKETEDETN